MALLESSEGDSCLDSSGAVAENGDTDVAAEIDLGLL